MKKFKFRLEKVLQFRKIVQDEKKRILNILMRQLREMEDTIEYLEKEFLNNVINEGAVLTVEELSLKGSYGERLKNELINKKLAMLDLNEKLEEARKAYIEATQEVEVLEKLRERKHEQYNEMIMQHEQKMMDELVTQRRGKRVSPQ